MHVLRLNTKRATTFWDPKNRFALAVGYRLEGSLPLGVDLSYIENGVLSGVLIDVNNTVFKRTEVNTGGSEDQNSEGSLQAGREDSGDPVPVVAQSEPPGEGNDQAEVSQVIPEPVPEDIPEPVTEPVMEPAPEIAPEVVVEAAPAKKKGGSKKRKS